MTRVIVHLLSWLAPFVVIFAAARLGRSVPLIAEWIDTAVIIYVLFFSVVIHELSHGAAAYYCGDDTAKNAGRLSLNPIRHVSVVGSIIVPLMLYFISPQTVLGWAKPVPLNPMKLDRYPRDQIFTAMAGPLANFVLVFISFICFAGLGLIYTHFHPGFFGGILLDFVQASPADGTSQILWQLVLKIFFHGIIINLVLGCFNLIPIPPLDGSWLLKALLPQKARQYVAQYTLLGMVVILLLLKAGFLSALLIPVHNLINIFVNVIKLIFP